MKATVILEFENIDEWEQYDNFTVPQMEKDLKQEIEEQLSPWISYDSIKIEIK